MVEVETRRHSLSSIEDRRSRSSAQKSALRVSLERGKDEEETQPDCTCLQKIRKHRRGAIEARDLDFSKLAADTYGNDVTWGSLNLRQQAELIKNGLRPKSCVLNPHAPYFRTWDLVVLVCLAITGAITPYEVAFLQNEPTALYFLNRVIDVVFVKDIIMSFFLKVAVQKRARTVWIKSHREIIKLYLRTWFVIDILSVLPYQEISDWLSNGRGDETVSSLRAVRVIRVIRIVKLIRIVKASRVIRNWQNRISLSTAKKYLIKFAVLSLTACHWMGCLWGFIGVLDGSNLVCRGDMHDEALLSEYPSRRYFIKFADEERDSYDPSLWTGNSWVVAFAMNRAARAPVDPCMPGMLYCASVYWAIMTMTSIGYGDILPITTAEYVVCCLCMMVGSTLWAYIIGAVASVLSTLNPEQTAFEQRMDAFNAMASDNKLPNSIRIRGRMYIREARAHEHYKRNLEVAECLGKDLRLRVAQQMASHYLEGIWIFHNTSLPFQEDATSKMVPFFFERKEVVELFGKLCVVERGVVVRKSRVIVPYGFWGTDMIVRCEDLREKDCAVTLAYTEIVTLSRDDLNAVVLDHPDQLQRLRRAAVLLAVRQVARIRLQGSALAETGFVGKLFDGLQGLSYKQRSATFNMQAEKSCQALLASDAKQMDSRETPLGVGPKTVDAQLERIIEMLGQDEQQVDKQRPKDMDERLSKIESKLRELEMFMVTGSQATVVHHELV
mmetsp:Transcript_30867/g.67555  ORF Transcript_30867/g.67555 Transcript_30867/m.67555 type:complete len:725 (+) Transcript_30867:103-2277(+)|eukprot:CAMPEP_0170615208 /NCGR_PEP_ID=MMETSP0224-20130122/25214_1 /TAXON_ID=285029 /ORGANISM="Togula jolla, Strain CCCM 725" /LENGTH=724 /DNA_ID=CAMNT_0010940923 /DNA_START=60 /DNA_END=2234 /DNA_ORIENTATION=+